MKFLDYPVLDRLSKSLTFESAECKVFTQLEAYSCKTVSKEKRLFKSIESQYMQSASMSPPDYLDETLASPFGRLDQPSARKVLFLLIATLNGAFPHHDFSVVSPSDFRRQPSSASVLNSLSTTLLSLRHNSNTPRSFSSYPSSHEEAFDESRSTRTGNIFDNGLNGSGSGAINHPELATVLDDIMDIKECEVYSFHPDAESDPHACADEEEEADDYDDRYVDGGLSSDDDDDEMRHRHSGSHDMDAPMFDEDYLSGGFQGDSNPASQPTTPRTPTSTRARAGDYFTSSQRKRQLSQAQQEPPRMSTSMSSSDSYDDDDEPSGLLWANYTFFYNRKMKRILFVSVWSRLNTSGAPHYGFSPPSYPMGSLMPSQNLAHTRTTTASTIATAVDESGDDMTPGPSPAKRAIARASLGGAQASHANDASSVTQRRSRRHGRSASGSPAPSSLSPFPHASPQPHGRRAPSNLSSAPTMANLDGTILSASAPVHQQSLAMPSTSSSLARQASDTHSSSPLSSSTKRTGGMARREDESRKHRRV